LVFSLPDAAILDECDVIFFATPHGVAMKGAGAFIEKGIKVIDLGADFRLNDKAEYQQWYKLEPPKSITLMPFSMNAPAPFIATPCGVAKNITSHSSKIAASGKEKTKSQ
jgi:hypothetical protein